MKTVVVVISLLINLLSVITCFSQDPKTKGLRKPAVAGTFYPADPAELRNQLSLLFDKVKPEKQEENIAAIIVPHAGYVFSGEVAASAFAKLDPGQEWDHIFLIGTSHHVSLDGASVYTAGDFQTPLGIVKVDTELGKKLAKESPVISFVASAHEKEHSLEVQLPFLQYHLKKPFKIVPIILGTQSAETCRQIADALKPYFNSRNLFVISTDFSHYPTYNNALKYDKITGDAIAFNSPAMFVEALLSNDKKNVPNLATSCCGWSSVLTLLYLTSVDPEIKIEHIKYLNSGDTQFGDKTKVVGYHSFIFTRDEKSQTSFYLDEKSKRFLLKVARESIETGLEKHPYPFYTEAEIPKQVKTPCGAFVTLNKEGKLRGCIGRFTPNKLLYQMVQDMARAAAFEDTRFEPLEESELKEIEIEISVLTPLKKIGSAAEYDIQKNGIYIVKGSRSGTFLPQVAHETGWTKEELLGHCARDKAGIGWNGWKDADLFTYEALVFGEHEMKEPRK